MNVNSSLIEVCAHPDLRAELSPFGAGLYQLYFKGKKMLYSGEKDEYFHKNPFFFGQTVAPFAGRIPQGKIGRFSFPLNEGPNCLHSGPFTTAFSLFDYRVEKGQGKTAVIFHHEQDVEGVHLITETTYEFFEDEPRFSTRIDVTSDQPFPTNPTHHACWSLGAKSLKDFDVRMAAHERVRLGEHKEPLGYLSCRDEFDGDRLKIHQNLDYGYVLDEPKVCYCCNDVCLTAETNAKVVWIFAGVAGRDPYLTMEFEQAPLNDDTKLKTGTSSVSATYRLEETAWKKR